MASSSGTRSRQSSNLIIKEGFLYKKGGIIKSWSKRYFMLNKQSLVYFRREQELDEGALKAGLSPLGRIFLSDIVSIETESQQKKKAFVFVLHTKKRAILLQASTEDEREVWVRAIKRASHIEGEAERDDPFRRTLRKLAPGLKRITLMKDPDKGIGCTIKNAAGHIFVNRIIEDGPIALTGVLRPGDELLDLNGTAVTNLSVEDVVKVIRSSPDEFLATVRPITALKKRQQSDMARINYVTIIPQLSQPKQPANGAKESGPNFVMKDDPHASDDSLDDVGNYDDEDEGDTPPPLPARTDDALIIVDPPPLSDLPRKPLTHHQLIEFEINHRPMRHGDSRPKMSKARSLGGSIDDDSPIFVPASGKRPPRVHTYEEIRPKLNYVDIDLAHNRAVAAAKARSLK